MTFFTLKVHLSPLCSGVNPPLPQFGQLTRPNPWQSKHFQRSKMFPFFLFFPVPLHPGHSTEPFPLHFPQPFPPARGWRSEDGRAKELARDGRGGVGSLRNCPLCKKLPCIAMAAMHEDSKVASLLLSASRMASDLSSPGLALPLPALASFALPRSLWILPRKT